MRVWKAARGLLTTVVVGGVAIGLCLTAIIPGAAVLVSAYDSPINFDSRLRNLSQRSTIYNSAGNWLGTLGTINREGVNLDEVPEVIQNAVVAVEDRTFWENDGVDYNAMVRALIKNLTSGEIEQGGSTITQQLVKKRLLSDKRDVHRKVKELILATQLNERYSKREILGQYLNTVYFGQGSYGIKSAVERFFKKFSLDEITIAEAALLAGVIANPEGDNPFSNPDRARARRASALDAMQRQHYITPAEAEAAKDEPLPTELPPSELRPTNAWVEEIQDQIVNDPGEVFGVLGETPAEREERLLTGGLRITAGLDPKIQAAATEAAIAGVPASMRARGFTMSILAMDPRTGVVQAMVPGTDFASSQYNIATSYPGRQGGSSWKALTLTAAIDAGFSPNDQVDGTTPCEFGPYGRTVNYESSPAGVLTLRAATSASVNCAFARIELAAGFDKVIDTAHKLGITQDLLPVLTLTLGVVEGTALEMANVAATLANNGIHRTPLFVSRIENSAGEVVFRAEDVQGERAVSEETAACTTNILQGVINGGTGGRARLAGRPVAGKTGTSDQNADANFMGYTPQLAAHIWYGNIAGRVPGAGAGGGVPAATFRQFFDAALAGEPALPFPPAGPACSRPGAYITGYGRSATPGVGFPTTTLPGPPPSVIINTTTTAPTTTTLPGP